MPIVTISMCSDRNYWLVNIECKDRNKLLFDTVCTLADLNYDVFHATIDSVNGRAVQEYYVRSRQGCTGGSVACTAPAGQATSVEQPVVWAHCLMTRSVMGRPLQETEVMYVANYSQKTVLTLALLQNGMSSAP